MNDSITKIKDIYKKQYERKTQLEQELKEIDENLMAINKTLRLLGKEESIPTSNKYKEWTKSDAIIDVLKSDKQKQWDCKNIVDQLKINGLKSKSTNLLRDVYAELARLKIKDEIIIIKTPNGKRYKAKQKESTPL